METVFRLASGIGVYSLIQGASSQRVQGRLLSQE